MQAWNGWFHINGNTCGTWVHGDTRGWRSRHHRDHVTGDYKHPPAPGMYDRLETWSENMMGKEPIRLPDPSPSSARAGNGLRVTVAGGAGGYSLARRGALSHPWEVCESIGQASRGPGEETLILHRFKTGHRRTPWAKGCHVLPIKDRAHQVNVYNYIRRHGHKGAFVWTYLDPAPTSLDPCAENESRGIDP